MFYRKFVCLLIIEFLIVFKSSSVYGLIDPITGAFALGAFAIGYLFNKADYTILNVGSCPKTLHINELQRNMDKYFFGQHIASKVILSALKGNLKRSSYNNKPLVMSFHGVSGCGKNFVADLIASHIFRSEKIKKLRHYIFSGKKDFPRRSKLNEYQEQLYTDIKHAILSCSTNVFVFDELQYIPEGLLDIIVPILENHDLSIDSRNSIFIFLTNAAGDTILMKYLELWNKGYSREQMSVQDFDSIIQKSAFNEMGGLMKSELIDSHIIDHYVPFLPLERVHVIQCIDAELKNLKNRNETMNLEVQR